MKPGKCTSREAPKVLIWKQLLYFRRVPRKCFDSGVAPCIKMFNGSAGSAIACSLTLLLLQQVPGVSLFHFSDNVGTPLSLFQCTHQDEFQIQELSCVGMLFAPNLHKVICGALQLVLCPYQVWLCVRGGGSFALDVECLSTSVSSLGCPCCGVYIAIDADSLFSPACVSE